MARAPVIVEKWSNVHGWTRQAGYLLEYEGHALVEAKSLESRGTRVRVYRRTPNGPEMIYESPKL